MVSEMRASDILRDAVMLARRDPWVMTATMLFGTVPTAYAAITMDPIDALRFSSLWGIVMYLPMVIITQRALAARHAIRPDAHRTNILPRAVGQGLLCQLGVLAGLVLLVIPGLVLMARWFVVLPALISRNCTVRESFAISWALTGRNLGTAVTMLALSILPFLAALLSTMVLGESTGSIIAQESLFTAAQISAWLMATSLYLALTEPDLAGAIATDIFA